MRAYDENKLTNIVLLEETDTFLNAGFITQEQADCIKNNLPVFFLRFGKLAYNVPRLPAVAAS